MRRGILGGTFDPPHLAHLIAGEAAFRQLDLDVVTFLPAGAPWQKADEEVSAAHHRLAMTELAVAPVEYFGVDGREVQRAGWTYTVDTLASFPGDEQLTLIVGADAAGRIATWHRWTEVVRRAHIAVVPRPGIEWGEVDAVLAEVDHVWLDSPEIALSGTEVRRRVRAGGSVRFLVPDPVWRYIGEHALYATPPPV